MKPIYSIIIAALATIATFTTITYSTSCSKDRCMDVVCLNKGACDGGTCYCLVGFEGSRCETYSRNKLIATFNGGDLCGDTARYHQYPLHFLAVPNKPLEIKVKNVLGDPDDSAVATMRGIDSFSFTGSNNSTSYYGNGTYRRDTLRMSYIVREDTTEYSCKYIGGSLR